MNYCTHTVIPKYIPKNLKQYERDGLDTWYLEGKSNDFLQVTDYYFNTVKVVNFDMIFNKPSLTEIINYKRINFNHIKDYPEPNQIKIKQSINRNIKKGNFHVKREHVPKLFVKDQFQNKKLAVGSGRFLKICKDSMYASCW